MLQEMIYNALLDSLGYKIEPWEAEELAAKLAEEVEEYIFKLLKE